MWYIVSETYIKPNTHNPRIKMAKNRKQHLNFYLETELIKRIDKISEDPNNIFDDRSKIIRFCIKQQLPLIEKQIEEERR